MKISIIIPVYNGEKYLGRAIRSCMSQNFNPRDYEVIIVNDGSTDNTSAIASAFVNASTSARGEPLIRLFTLEENRGIGYACNEGIKQALGQFVVRVDADDFVHEDLLNVEFLFLWGNKDWDAVACDYFIVDDRENIITRKDCSKKPIACGIMYRKDILINTGLYDPNLKLHEDKEFRQRFLKDYAIQRIPLPLYKYRLHEGNSTLTLDK